MDLATFTFIHVVVSVVAILAGLVVIGGLIAGARLRGWTALFLITTIYTSASGFGFPFTKVLPPHIVGVLSLVVLAVCVAALYWKRLAGRWRAAYVVTAVIATYLNFFVLVVQLFAKTPALVKLAPRQQELPFVITQALVLGLFVWLGRAALRGPR